MVISKARSAKPFNRDAFTWLAYLSLAYYSYMQTALGPIVPFLRAELNLNYTLTGLHLSGFALGMLLAGLTGDTVARWFGRRVVFWGGGAGMILGGILLISSQHVALTLSGSLIMGLLGSHLLVMIQATLSDHHGDQRAIGLTESNIAASLFAILPPFFIRIGEANFLGWRLAYVVGMIFWLLLLMTLGRIAVPHSRQIELEKASPTTRPSRLPAAFWALWLVIFFGVSIEWCAIYWGADFLQNHYALTKETAAFLMSVFFGAMLIGRVIGSRLTYYWRSRRLLLAALIVVTVGFPIFWLARVTSIGIVGLFISGLGIANLFPLALATASNMFPNMTDAVSARVSFGGGMAMFVMPQVIGMFADRTSIQTAYGSVPVLLVLAIISIIFAERLAQENEKGNAV